ncbi:hypothetical protein DMENIID0001_007110 [Sergentomyia squamirostris]
MEGLGHRLHGTTSKWRLFVSHVMVDYFRRFLEVEIMRKITTEDTVKRLERIFQRLGLPETITLDNARQFASKEFKKKSVRNEASCFTIRFPTGLSPTEKWRGRTGLSRSVLDSLTACIGTGSKTCMSTFKHIRPLPTQLRESPLPPLPSCFTDVDCVRECLSWMS